MVPAVTLQVDARDKILGRLCSYVAKQALLGKRVVIENAKDAVISGKKRPIYERYLTRQGIHTASNPRRGPFWPHRPDTLLKRTIRGMLPKNSRGKAALKRVHTFISELPEFMKTRYDKLEPWDVPKSAAKRLQYKYITLGNLCMRIGWKKKRHVAGANEA